MEVGAEHAARSARRAPRTGPWRIPVAAIALLLRTIVAIVTVVGTLRRFSREQRARITGAERSLARSRRGAASQRARAGASVGTTGTARTAMDDLVGDVQRVQRRRLTEAEQRERIRRANLLRRRLRVAVGVLGVAALLAGWYQVPRLPVFDVQHVAVQGASAVSDLTVRSRVEPYLRGRTIYTVDEEAIVRELRQLPFVNSVHIDHHFPDTVGVRITEYAPLAFGVSGNSGWLVARDGRVLTRGRLADWKERVPVVRIEARSVDAGDRVGDEPALRVLRGVPRDFPGAFRSVEVTTNLGIVAKLHDGTELRLGRPVDVGEKLQVTQTVLQLYAHRRDQIGYVDVSVKARPAIGWNLE